MQNDEPTPSQDQPAKPRRGRPKAVEDPEVAMRDREIKDRVRRAILSKQMKIKKFARESGMAYPSLRDYYSGLRKPGFDAIRTIVDFTGVSADWLLLGKGPMFPGQEPADVDEKLLGKIAIALDGAFSHGEDDEIHTSDEGDFDYSPARREREAAKRRVGRRAAMAANVYNRLAHLEPDDQLDDRIEQEARAMVRLEEGMSFD